MGVDLKPLVKARVISLHDLKGKVIAIDAYNTIHQFLSIIRQRDGTPWPFVSLFVSMCFVCREPGPCIALARR